MHTIANKIDQVRTRIAAACEKASRDPDTVRLLAVSKTKPVSMIEAAISAGQNDFGENYLQESRAKIRALPDATWHYIGAIQSNKTREIASLFHWVHTVASGKVARRLNHQRPPGMPPLNILLQVNISGESGKAGADEKDLPEIITAVRTMENLNLRGLMAIPRATPDEGAQRRAFARLAGLLHSMRTRFDLTGFTELSMGMSNDLEAAIMEGATWVRIGTAIFGTRDQKEKHH